MFKKILYILILAGILSMVIWGIVIVGQSFFYRRDLVGFSTRGFSTLQSNVTTSATYSFGVVNIPTERAGAASSSTGFEFGKFLPTSATAFTVASTSTGFAITMNKSGKILGCSFDLQTLPTTGTVSVQIQQNGTLLTGKYCTLPRSGTFATLGGLKDMSTYETIADSITFVAGDRFGLIASSSNLNAATFDGMANLILKLDN